MSNKKREHYHGNGTAMPQSQLTPSVSASSPTISIPRSSAANEPTNNANHVNLPQNIMMSSGSIIIAKPDIPSKSTAAFYYWDTRQQSHASNMLDTTIEPIVRRLLILCNLHPSPNNNNTTPTEQQFGMEMERLKQMKQLLIVLQRAVEHVVDNVDAMNKVRVVMVGNNNNETTTQQKLVHQMNGIAMPLLRILHYQQQPPSWSNKQLKTAQKIHVILQSANYGCMEKAAYSLSTLWEIAQRFVVCNDGQSESSSGIIQSLVLPSLVSCTMALSTLGICNEQTGVENNNGSGESSGKAGGDNDEEMSSEGVMGGSANNNQSLDQGEDCAMALLSCMQSFVHNEDVRESSEVIAAHDRNSQIKNEDELQNNNDEKLSDIAREVASAMGGALVARIVQSCLQLLPQDNINNISTSNNDPKVYQRDNNAKLQLEALKTLKTLMIGVPSDELWRSILPGCFAGLYRSALSKLRYSSAASSHKVASTSVEVLVILLKQSLRFKQEVDSNSDLCTGDSIQSITNSLLAAVQLSKQQTEGNYAAPPEKDEQTQQVKIEVNKRLVGPLSVLLSMLPANRSSTVRKSGLHLCRIILVDIQSVWTESNKKALGRKSLEYCLMVLGDDNNGTSNYSRRILQTYKSHLGMTKWKRQLSQTIAPTILELVEALPAFAKSGRESEVRNYLRLIDGYLVLSFRGMDNDFDLQECFIEKRKSDVGSALSCTEAVDIVKKSFSVLFTPDIQSITCGPLIEADSNPNPNKMVLFQQSNKYRFLYLKDEEIEAAKNTVRLFARTLGAKRCAYVVDACFAEMFESCSRTCNDRLLVNEGLHLRLQWAGLCVFATELLRGLHPSDDARKSKSSLNILSSLASSVLPVVVGEPLWTLPTTLGNRVSSTSYSQAQKMRDSSSNDTTRSVTIMNSNAIMVSSLMGLICQFTHALGDAIMMLHLPTILFPLLERASPIGNHSSVQRAAFLSLWEVSLAIGYSDISSLLASNFDYLVDAISLRLKRYAREQSPMERSLLGVVDVILQSLVHHGRSDSSLEQSGVALAAGHVAMIGHLLKCLLSHFDRQSYMTNLSLFDTVGVFRSMGIFMETSIDFHIYNHRTEVEVKSPETGVDEWFQRLDFELDISSGGYHDDESKDDMFREIEPTDEGEPLSEADLQHSSDDQGDTDFVHEIAAINSILTRCCYLLSYADLQIQVLCCETMQSGLRSLGKIGAFRKNLRGEAASNPLLPSIGEFWPSIIARLRSTSTSLASVNKLSRSDLAIRHAMAKDQEQGPSRAGLEVLMSKLLLVISELCLGSDGFFEDRFTNDVYPIIARLLKDILPRDGRLAHKPTSLVGEKHSLLLPILQFFKTSYGSSCGDGLVGLIPSTGTMIFPLLSFEGPIGSAAVDAVKAMLAVDCDALWRSLQNLSGRSFPCHPVVDTAPKKYKGRATTATMILSSQQMKTENVLSQRAVHLLEFIECLPEQPVV